MRRALMLMAGLMALLTVALAGLWLARRPLAGWGLEMALARAGLPGAEVTVTALGPHGLAAGPVRLGPQRLTGLTARWTPRGLLAGRIETVRLEGLRLTGRIAAGRLSLPGLTAPESAGPAPAGLDAEKGPAPGGSSRRRPDDEPAAGSPIFGRLAGPLPAAPALPIESVHLGRAQLTLEEGAIPLQARLSGRMASAGRDGLALTGDLRFELAAGPGHLAGRLRGRWDAAGAELLAEIDSARASAGAARLTGLEGWLAAGLARGARRPRLMASLAARGRAAGGGALRAELILAETPEAGARGPARLLARLSGPAGAAGAEIRLRRAGAGGYIAEIAGTGAATGLPAFLPAPLRAALTPPLTGRTGATAARLTVTPGAAWRLDLPALILADGQGRRARLAGLRASGSAEAGGTASGAASGAAVSKAGRLGTGRLEAGRLEIGRLDLAGRREAGLRLGPGTFTLAGRWGPAAAQGRLAGQIAAAGAVAELSLAPASAKIAARWAVDSAGARLVLTECLALSGGALALGPRRLTLPEGLCLEPAGAPLLAWRRGDGAPRLAVRLPAANLTLADPKLGRLAGTLPAGVLRAAPDRGRLDFVGQGGRLAWPAGRLIAEDLDLDLAWRPDAESGPLTAALTAGRLVDRRQPAWLRPLTLTAEIAGDPAGRLTGAGRARIAQTPATLSWTGRYAPGRGAGRFDLELDLSPVTLAPDGLALARLSPLAAAHLDQARGRLGFEARLRWPPPAGAEGALGLPALAGSAELLLSELGGQAGAVRFEGVSAVLAADRLWPPRLPGGQTLYLGLVDPGLPLIGGEVTLGVAGLTLELARARWQAADGEITAGPAEIPLDGRPFRLVLRAQGLDLAELLAIADVEGLSGTGTLDGRLPVVIAGGAWRIAQGELIARAPGRLSYEGGGAKRLLGSGGGAEMAARALRDFRYEALRVTVEASAGGEQSVRLHIAGANPDLLEGYPIELNVNLSGALEALIRQGLGSYRLPERIRKEILKFGAQDSASTPP